MISELDIAIKNTLQKTRHNLLTFLTGAGISVDSGIPAYRRPNGIWEKSSENYKPEAFGTLAFFLNNPEEVWQYALFRKELFTKARPNSNHYNITEIESVIGGRFELITQNIDGLHAKAGTKRILEKHGNLREVKCSQGCKGIFPLSQNIKGKNMDEPLTDEEIAALKCDKCGGWLRPNILWFDESYDEQTNKKLSSLRAAKKTGILFVIGTSGATSLPMQIAQTALKHGSYIVDLNKEENAFTDLIRGKKNAIIIRDDIKDVLPHLKDIITFYNNGAPPMLVA